MLSDETPPLARDHPNGLAHTERRVPWSFASRSWKYQEVKHDARRIATRGARGYSSFVNALVSGALRCIFGKSPRKTLNRVVLLALLTLLLFGLWLRPVVVRGHSMEPTLADGALLIGTRWWFDAQRHPGRGDVVVIRRAGGRVFYLKRVLALPGETIAFTEGLPFIDGKQLVEPYRSADSNWNMPATTLGVDEYFVAGDNRSMPMQEHAAGIVQRHNFAGELWP